MQDIDELIEMFKAADDRNYTLFTYVNELNQEVAKLEEQVKAIHSEIDSVQQQDATRENERQRSQQEVLIYHSCANCLPWLCEAERNATLSWWPC